MEVTAKKVGYYNNRRIKEGVSFVLKSEKDYSVLWMDKTDKAVSKKVMSKFEGKKAQDEDVI